MELKDWVREARTNKHMTQTQLGEALGVSKANVSAWENGHHEPSWSQMLKTDILVTPDKEDLLAIIGRVFWMGARI